MSGSGDEKVILNNLICMNLYEIDFMIVKKKKICPIEVKSSNYMSHKSFDYLLQKYQLKCEHRFIIYTKDLKYQDGIMYIPIYMTMLL